MQDHELILSKKLVCYFRPMKTVPENIFRGICTGERTPLTHLRMIASLHSESYKAEEKGKKIVTKCFVVLGLDDIQQNTIGISIYTISGCLRLLLSEAGCFNSLQLRW